MNAWAQHLPRVTVEKTDVLKPITIVYPYYENPLFLREQLEHLATLDGYALVRGRLSVILVDDGSPTHPAREVLRASPWPAPVRLFEIETDVPWNWLAARNIGAHHAAAGWLLLTDMDHKVPLATLLSLMWGNHDPAVIYGLSRMEHTGQVIPPHSASFFLTRALFWRVGGYDEMLSGHYGSDGDWRRRCAAVAPMKVLSDALVRYEHVADSSTTRYARKLPTDTEAIAKLIAARPARWMPKTLSFPYHEVAL